MSGAARAWTAIIIGLVLWSAIRAGLDIAGLVNTGGRSQVSRFFGAMFSPRLDADFVWLAVREAGVTLGYALLGTALSLLIGLIGGVLLTERIWTPLAGPMGGGRSVWLGARLLFAVPRSMHEVVFGLLLVNILGLDPLVAILAIGIPFGAVTAKVFSELLDEVPADAERALRASGASRFTAMMFGTVPQALGDLLSYAFYRFECALRSAAVLGIVGAGGLGFQLALSFISLRYDEMWTFLWALIILSGLADRWSSAVRSRRNSAAVEMHLVEIERVEIERVEIERVEIERVEIERVEDRPRSAPPFDRFLLASSAVCVLALPIAYWRLDVDVSNLWAGRAITLGTELATNSWPPRVGAGGWSSLISDSFDTVALAVLSIVGAIVVAFPLAFVAARPTGDRRGGNLVRRIVGWATRLLLLIARSIPPPVGAFIAVFILFPGLWPGALALAIYNGGVLGRLQAEVVENVDKTASTVLRAGGADGVGAAAYGTMPVIAGKFSALGLYRWEVAVRETVVVGVVGAAGLGRRLDEQTSSFDYDGILATIIALLVVTIAVDLASASIRRTIR